MYRLLAIFSLLFATSIHAEQAENPLEAFIEAEMSRAGVPGLTYGVTIDGLISGDEQGVNTAGQAQAITQDTVFIIGSVSKSFTALGVMQLAEAGELELDSSIARYLDVFSDKSQSAITIRQLMSHTSGYSTLQGNLSQTDFTTDAEALERRVAKLAAMTPSARPGETWEYSNANYQILGRIIEVVSGRDYPSYIKANILDPIGMKDSFVHPHAEGAIYASGHRPWYFGKRVSDPNLTGAGSAAQGGIASTGRDMARYLGMMMNGQDDILSAAGKAQMMQPASEASPFYGFGWFIDAERGVVYHSGSNPGYEALAMMIPAERKGVAVLVNAGSGIAFGQTSQLRNGVSARALGLDYNGEADPIQQKATYLLLILAPVVFVISILWAWFKRDRIRAKPGTFGLFSLWFPLLMTIGMAWVTFGLVPTLIGAPFDTIFLFQPDVGLAMIACVVTGIAWALWRLLLAYWPKRAEP